MALIIFFLTLQTSSKVGLGESKRYEFQNLAAGIISFSGRARPPLLSFSSLSLPVFFFFFFGLYESKFAIEELLSRFPEMVVYGVANF